MKNTLKEKMKTRPVFGMTIYSGSAAVVEALGHIGFDFAFIDAEHSPLEVTDLREIILGARLAGVSPLVRVTRPDEIEIRKAFEMGAEGVIVPHVRTKEDAEICVRGAKFPPIGRRGYDSTVRSANYGFANFNAGEYIENSNGTELVIPMAEDFEFMDNIKEIFEVNGLDVINFGPADFALSKNIRIFYDMSQEDVQKAMKEISEKCNEKGMGLMAPAVPPTKENIEALIAKGVNMIICGSDMYNYQSAASAIKKNAIDKII
ncbi:MAG: aldolase/citrate lyase family protein [Oscillospiraceae bacterium]|jgi:4-hydroxy-2-oxoheptanedioate aldolase